MLASHHAQAAGKQQVETIRMLRMFWALRKAWHESKPVGQLGRSRGSHDQR